MAADAVQLRQAKRASAALDAEIAQVFSSAMPAVEMQDARRQMQTRLDRIRHSGPGPQHFLRTLQALSEAISGEPEYHHRFHELPAGSARNESPPPPVWPPSRSCRNGWASKGWPRRSNPRRPWPPVSRLICRCAPPARRRRARELSQGMVFAVAGAGTAHRRNRRRGIVRADRIGRNPSAPGIGGIERRENQGDEARGSGVDARQCAGDPGGRRSSWGHRRSAGGARGPGRQRGRLSAARCAELSRAAPAYACSWNRRHSTSWSPGLPRSRSATVSRSNRLQWIAPPSLES